MAFFAVVACLVIGVFLAATAGDIERRHYQIIAARPITPYNEWVAQFFPEPSEPSSFALLALEKLARRLRVSSQQLRPSDRFDRELSPKHWLIMDSDVDLFSIELERLCREHGVKFGPFSEDAVTLGVCVTELAALAAAAKQQGKFIEGERVS